MVESTVQPDLQRDSIVLLYNDRERAQVESLYRTLRPMLRPHGLRPWMAHLDQTACYSLFENIYNAIAGAVGSIICIGPAGLGEFLKNIEKDAVFVQRWRQGSRYGVLVLCLDASSQVPPSMLQWPTVNHDGSCADTGALARSVMQRFGLAESTDAG